MTSIATALHRLGASGRAIEALRRRVIAAPLTAYAAAAEVGGVSLPLLTYPAPPQAAPTIIINIIVAGSTEDTPCPRLN